MTRITKKDVFNQLVNRPSLETDPKPVYYLHYDAENDCLVDSYDKATVSFTAELDTGDEKFYPKKTDDEIMDYFYSRELETNPYFMDCVDSLYRQLIAYCGGNNND